MSSLMVYDTELQHSTALSAPPGAALLWYSCGPTVYDTAHIGHARAYVCQDIIRRIIEGVMQQPLMYVMGMTDVDDKIIQRAAEEGRSWRQHAAAYEGMFLRDMQALGVQLPHHIARVSEHIPTIVAHIQEIESAGLTYRTPSGLYFDVEAFPGKYGKLRPHSSEAASMSAPSTVGLSDKRSAADFALWKASKEEGPSWGSPWGEGRPGWHIECSAMAAKVLGKKLHMHSGGVDLAFPHHTNEIAQTEASLLPAGGACCGGGASPADALQGFKWVDAWMHCGHVHIEGRKMSKSLKNFISVQDMKQELGSTASATFRMWCLQRHYRSNVTWDTASVQQAATARQWWATWSSRTRQAELQAWQQQVHSGRLSDPTVPQALPWGRCEGDLHAAFVAGMTEARSVLSSDFDAPAALGALKGTATAVDAYIKDSSVPNALLVLQVRSAVQAMFRVLGVPLPHADDAWLGSGEDEAGPSQSNQADMTGFDQVNGARVHLRQLALAALQEAGDGEGGRALAQSVLEACDTLREHVLPRMNMGSAVSDDATAHGVALRAWTALRASPQTPPPSSGHQAKAAKLADWQESAHWTTMSVEPAEVFRVDDHLYQPFEGPVPSHLADGTAISKNRLKKMRKAAERYATKFHETQLH